MNSFSDLGLIKPLRRALEEQGYSTPTPIQARAIPVAVQGIDVLGVAQTGTGKTAAFTLPILQQLTEDRRKPTPNSPRALVLTPTRELAIQIGASLQTYGAHLRLRHTEIFGGVSQRPQVTTLNRGIDTLVATPGRLLDLMNQKKVYLDHVEIFVLDEADRMLDMGFIRDVQRVLDELPEDRQTMLFSATMPNAITKLASEILWDYERIEIKPAATTAERVEQRILFVEKADKSRLLDDLFRTEDIQRAIVFTRTKWGADKVAKYLVKRRISASAIHGNKSQNARQRALEGFRRGEVRALVATDIASRGIDVDEVSHVVNFDLPNEPESYVHRIGRTARAGADGIAFSFCAEDELEQLMAIEKTIRSKVEVHATHAHHADRLAKMHASGQRPPKSAQKKRSSQNNSSRRRRWSR